MNRENILKLAKILKKHEKISVRILNGDVGLEQLVEHIKKARQKKMKK